MKKMMVMALFALGSLCAVPAMAQREGGGRQHDPKQRMEKISEKLNLTADQKAQVEALNQKYAGANVDKKQYREEFRSILTDGQKKQLDDMHARRMQNRKAKGNGE